jgi:hypothetical protein
MLKKCVVLIAVCLAAVSSSFAQFEAGSVTGTIKDPSGAVLPGASVELRNQMTNDARTVTSSSDGLFNFVNIQPGKYTLTATAQGFSAGTRVFDLAVGQRLQVDIDLSVVSATQSVSVTAESVSTLETGSSALGMVQTSQTVQSLPLDGRNFTQLIGLAPGTNMRGHSNNSQSLGYTNGRGANGAVVNGNPGEDTIYLYDGIQSINNDIAAVIFFPSVDSIAEFKVQTSGAPAAYGGGPSIVNLTIRSGTNAYHGTFFEFVRTSQFDAKNYFDSHTAPITPFHLNQFGANVGGPVVIPHLFNGRDKLFFFADYEGKRQNQAQTYISTLPIPAFLTGDFSALCTGNGGTFSPEGLCSNTKLQLKDPFNGTQFLNNFVSPTLWNSSVPKLITLFPAPNYPTSTATGLVSNYLFNGAVVNNVDQGDIRIDYRRNETAIFGRFSKENALTVNPGYLPAPAVGGGPSRPGTTPISGEQIVLGYGRSFGATTYYEARLAWSRLVENIVIANNGLPNLSTEYGIPGANAAGIPGLTNFAITGQVGLGDGFGNLSKIDNNWEVDQAFTMTHGHHELKAGFDWLPRQQSNYDPLYPAGNFTFSGAYTGYGLADFLLGHPISSELDSAEFLQLRRHLPSFYVQDTYRALPNLVLEFGIRNDLVTPWTIKHNKLAGFDPSGNNGQGALIPVGTAPFNGDSVVDGRYTNWGPRVGFSLSIDPKTVLRGGFGIFYANENQSGNPFQANAPFHGSYITTNATGTAGFAAANTISGGFPSERPTVFPTAGTTVNYYVRSYKNPTTNEYSLNLQRQVTSHDVLSIAYVGQTAAHILIVPNINQPALLPGPVNPNRPFPGFAAINETCQCANSAYNSFQASYQAQFPNVLNVLAAYTYSHSTDNSSGTGNVTAPQDPFNWWHSYRGNSDWDIRQSFVLSWTYDFPFGKNKKFGSDAGYLKQLLIGGWQLNSIDTFQTGTPFTPTMNTSQLNTGGSVQYPNRIGSGKLSNRGPKAWFNIADFTAPGVNTFGNSGRNILYGPGTDEVDTSLFKNIALSKDGAIYLQLRVEAFNVFNTPQFNNPNAAIGNGAAGTITSAGTPVLFQRTSREMQFAGKLYW